MILCLQTLMCVEILLFQELPIFLSMVNDVFGGVDSTSAAVRLNEPFVQEVLSASLCVTPTANTKLVSPHKLAFVSDLLKQQAAKSCLVPSCRWMAKVEELFVQSQLKHGIICSRISQGF